METKEETIKMRKTNMKIYPIYKALSWDYLFFYTIDFLFFTQIKNISAASVILKDSFYSLFCIIGQIPANIIIEFLGRRNSIILGNILNCLYMVVIMLSRNLGDLILAEFICAIAFSIKDTAQPSLLNESIPPSRYKSKIFSKISAKGASVYYLFNAITKIIAGFLFVINGYLPIFCSLGVLILATVISIGFIEPVKKSKRKQNDIFGKQQFKDIKDGFIYIFKSERLKALILCASLMVALLDIAGTYHVSLLEDLEVSSIVIGIIAAIGNFISAYACKKQEEFHNRRRNKSLLTLAFILSMSSLIAGLCGIASEKIRIFIIIISITNILFNFCNGMYYTLIDKYLSNFSNEKIDTKIFSANNLFTHMIGSVGGFFAAFLIDKVATKYCMIIVGIAFTILYILLGIYMKSRVGLSPEQYSKEETKYDEQELV